MTDLISIFTLVFLGAVILLWVLNLEQARSLHQMANSLDEMHLLQLKKRRDQYKKNLKEIDALDWIQFHSGSTQQLVACLEGCDMPAWVNFSAEDGSRLVVSPFAPKRLSEVLGGKKSRRSRVGSAHEPLLGYSPRKVRILSRSLADEEWFDLEAAEVGRQLEVNWGEVTRLWFYIIPKKGRA
jgi:hypothetical protein